MITTAFVFHNDTILCRKTTEGWWPLQIELPKAQSDPAASNNQLGRVALLASLAPNYWQQNSPMAETKSLPATSAITYDYAKNNGITLPNLTDSESIILSSDQTGIFTFIDYRLLITQLPVTLADQLSQAIQLLRWQADTQFCSRCSAPVSSAKSGERSMVCPVCQLRQYPRVQPCIITAITRPNPQTGETQLLLAHHHRYGKQNRPMQYGLLAGFVEVGESLEHAVVREVKEEVGITLKDIRYVSSQPWPFPSNLMLGFRATYNEGEIVLQEDELSHADFFDLSNMPKIPPKGSIAHALIAQIAHEQGITL